MSREKFNPLSLAQHFEPSEGYIGRFGWICGYSADAAFINDAAERFVGATHLQRAHSGDIVLALVLDPGDQQLSLDRVPGVLHIPFAIARPKPFRLMHAKVALLGYRAENDERWLLRLLVGTGNWTRETLKQSLDLVWRLEIRGEDLRVRPGPLVRQACADVHAAWDLFEFLRSRYDGSVLEASRPDGSAAPWQARVEDMSQWIAQSSAHAGKVRPRVFDNREHSLLEQLPKLVQQHASSTKRNYLAMGSGFFEKAQNRKSAPAVLEKIVSALQEQELLASGDPDINIFVNPDACQAVAHSIDRMTEIGWNVRLPGQPADFAKTARTLHAKFLFSANDWSGSNNCNSPWVYLGSGNLTSPGFDKAMSANGGNLEAGVVFAPGKLFWERRRGAPDEAVVKNLLPIQWDEDGVLDDPSQLQPGRDMEERTINFIAPPVAWVWWTEGWLRPSHENAAGLVILDDRDKPCERDERHYFRWPPAEPPPQVRVRWKHDGKDREALVPVVDQHGRIAARPLRKLEIADAWNELAGFPMPPDEEEIPEDAEESSSVAGVAPARGGAGKAKYPVRSMMELIENIADKQSALMTFDWTTWCARLEQCLGQAADSDIVKQFRELRLNALSPLWHKEFRPAFAATDVSPEGKRYESALRGIEDKWQVADLPKIGGSHEPGVPGVDGSGQAFAPVGE